MKKIKFIILLLLSVLAIENAHCQPGCPGVNAGSDMFPDCNTSCVDLTATAVFTGATTSYTVSSIPYNPPYPYNSGVPILVNQDDKWSGVVNLPFSFCFFGNLYNSIVVGSNGCLTFNTALANKTNKCPQSATCPDPNIVPTNTGAYILGCYTDLDPSVAGSAIYQAVLGAYPCRTYMVNFYHVALYPQNPPLCVNKFVTFQIVLYESTNVVEIYTEDKPLCIAWNNGNAVTGIQNDAGTLGYSPPGRNTGQWTATNEAWRFTPSGTPNFNFTWYDGGIPMGSSPTINVCPTTTTTYTSEVIYNCCTGNQVSVTDDVTVNVLPNISLSINNPVPSICVGGSTTLTSTSTDPAAIYSWSNGDSGSTITVNPVVTTVYTVTATSPLCTMQSSTTVTVIPYPVISPASNSPVCTGDTLNLSSGTAAGYTYIWSGPNGFSDNQQNPSIKNVTSGSAGNYSVTVTNGGQCSVSGQTSVIINTTPAATVSSNSPQCSGSPLNLSSSGGTTYSWSGPNSFSSNQQNPSVASSTVAATGVYTVTVTNANSSCSSTAQTNVVINPTPVLSITGINVNCNGASSGSADLTVTGGTANYTYNWNNGTYISQNLINIPAGTYDVTVTDSKNCTASTSILITEPSAPLTASVSGTNILCTGGANSSADLTVTGGTPGYIYLWSNSAATEDLSNLSAGSYTVTVTDAVGCTSSAGVTITQPAVSLSCAVSATNVSCFGGTSGSIDLTVTGGVAAYSYLWNNSATTEDITGISAGTYIVTVTDANGCTATNTVNVTQPSTPLTTTIGGTNVSCFGGTDGAADLTVTGGTSAYVYQWSNSSTTQDITGLSAGTYFVTVTDAFNCQTVSTINVTEPLAPLSVSVAGTNVPCIGGATSSADLTVSGGTPPYLYLWSNSATTQDIFNLSGGTYDVTVTDAEGCTATSGVSLIQPTLSLTCSVATTNVSCHGSATGSADLTATGGFAPYIYIWSNSSTTEDLTGIAAGTYTVTVTDANGCTATVTTTVAQPSAPLTGTIAGTNVSCFGGFDGAADLTVTGGTAAYVYQWSNSSTTEDLTGLAAGTYSVTITDALNCTTVSTMDVTQAPASLSAFVAGTNVACYGNSTGSANLTVSGGSPGYNYNWSSGSQTEDLSNIAAGTYTVTITDTKGCSVNAGVTITQPSAPVSATVSGTNIPCFGNLSGGADLTVSGGTPGYTYLWNTSALTEDITGIGPGLYSVTITDAAQCTATTSITIIQPLPLILSVTGINVLCNGNSTGSADLTPSGGTPGYTYNWNYSSNSQDLINIPAGNYLVTVTDINGCTESTGIMITQPLTPLSASITGTNILCYGNSTGVANLNVSGGTPGYIYKWSSGPVTEDLANITAGIYTVTVTDAAGCTDSATVIISQPQSPLTASVSGSNVLCFGGSDGTADLTVSGGTPGYSYIWSGGQPTEDLFNIPSGAYTVTITDANGCNTNTGITVNQPMPLIMNFTSTDVSCFGGNDGKANWQGAGGQLPYSASWLPSGTSGGSALPAGVFTLIITDSNGCTVDTTFTINQPAQLTLTYTTDSVKCFSGNDGMINIIPSGGSYQYFYVWSPPVSTTNTASNIGAGTYNVTITDSKGCSASTDINVFQPQPLNFSTSGDISICSGATTTISAAATGGTGIYTYIWNTGIGDSINVSPAFTTTYTVSVTDSYGCTSNPQDLTVTVSSPITVTVSANPQSLCQGANSVLTATANGGNGNYIYTWSQGSTTPAFTAAPAATTIYGVTITDNCGSNPVTDSVQVTVHPPPLINFTSDITGGCEPLRVNFTDFSSPDINSWLWDFGDYLSGTNTSDLRDASHYYSSSGTYSVTLTVITVNGCTGSLTISDMIEVYPNPDAIFSVNPAFATTMEPVISFMDFSTDASFLNWNFGDTLSGNNNYSDSENPQHTYIGSGNFNVILYVQSAHGCTDSASHQVFIEEDFIFYAPNAFTPDGNNRNDYFAPLGKGWDPDNFTMYIYDRWGKLIFESNDISKYWDGRVDGSNMTAPQGSYVWLVKLKGADGIKHIINGMVTIIRSDL